MNAYQIPANAILLTAKGVAKSLKAELQLFVVTDNEGNATIAATSSLNGNSAIVGPIFPKDFKNCLHIGEETLKTLFNKTGVSAAYILVEGYKKEEFKAAKQIVEASANTAAKAELAAIPTNTAIKVWTGTTSSSIYGAFKMEGVTLSPLATKMLEDAIVAGTFQYERDEQDNFFCNTTVGNVLQTGGAKIEAKEAARTAKFAEAKETGKAVVISSYVVAESETPLKNDGEGDMVTVYELAMPDGSTKTSYEHNY